jgi:hypothetical protein
MHINKIELIQMSIVRPHKKMPSVNKPVLMRIKIALQGGELAEVLVVAASVAVIWVGLDVNLLKAFT